MKKMTFFLLFFCSVVIIRSAAFSNDGHRHHHAHQHGVATLGAVQESNKISILFQAPASDLAGFEHAAQSDEELKAILQLENTLKNTENLFALNKAAKCDLHKHKVTHALINDKDNTHKHSHHNHNHSHSHDHNENHKGTSHSEIFAEYHFQCKDAKELSAIEVKLFTMFPSLTLINASVVTPGYQNKQKLRLTSSTLNLSP